MEEEEMVLNVASTHIGHFATKTEGRIVEKELQGIKHKKEGTDRKKMQFSNHSQRDKERKWKGMQQTYDEAHNRDRKPDTKIC
jgi:hypothetical protein